MAIRQAKAIKPTHPAVSKPASIIPIKLVKTTHPIVKAKGVTRKSIGKWS